MASQMMDTYSGGRGQREQRHLSVWVNLCMIVNQNLPNHFEGRTSPMPVTTVLKVLNG